MLPTFGQRNCAAVAPGMGDAVLMGPVCFGSRSDLERLPSHAGTSVCLSGGVSFGGPCPHDTYLVTVGGVVQGLSACLATHSIP